MLLRGNTTPTPPPFPPSIFITITTTTTITLQHQTSLLYLHSCSPPPPRLFSWALGTVRCCQARTERREADRQEEVWLLNNSSSVCTGDVTLHTRSTITWQYRSSLSPLYILFMVSLLMCPVCIFCFWLVQELCCSCDNELLVTSEAEGNFFCFLNHEFVWVWLEIRECHFKVMILHHDEFSQPDKDLPTYQRKTLSYRSNRWRSPTSDTSWDNTASTEYEI